jgi:hypothetical protein
MSRMKKPSGYSFIVNQTANAKPLPGSSTEDLNPASQPRVLMRNGEWLVPEAERPAIKRSSPSNKSC